VRPHGFIMRHPADGADVFDSRMLKHSEEPRLRAA
jgi:hypothetical protein